MYTMLKSHPKLADYARPTVQDTHHKFPKKRQFDDPVIHYGLIASGDAVTKRQGRHNELRELVGDVLCVETEAAGLLSSAECIVVRGISDYADAQKNDDWRCYAAATAAACAKELLTYVSAPQKLAKGEQRSINPSRAVGAKMAPILHPKMCKRPKSA